MEEAVKQLAEVAGQIDIIALLADDICRKEGLTIAANMVRAHANQLATGNYCGVPA